MTPRLTKLLIGFAISLIILISDRLSQSSTTTEVRKKRETKARLNNMMDKAVEQTVDTSDMISNWGLEGDHHFMRKPYQEKMKVLKKLKDSSKLKKIGYQYVSADLDGYQTGSLNRSLRLGTIKRGIQDNLGK